MYPTALIPYCDFGGNMSAMGVKIENFDFPVCNSFKAKIVNDKLCYEVDPNQFRNGSENEMNLGIGLLLDYNEDRQFDIYQKHEETKSQATTLKMKEALIRPKDEKGNHKLYLGTIGKLIILCDTVKNVTIK